MRRGGGVAIYVSTRYTATVFVPSLEDQSDRSLELLWIRVEKQSRIYLIGGIYHPPKPTYHDSDMFQCIEHSLDEMPLGATVCLCGDFNNLSDDQVQSLGLLPVKTPPTRGTKQLDRIYVSEPIYEKTVVFDSTVKSDHKAVYASSGCGDSSIKQNCKIKSQCKLRRCVPAQNARYLEYMKNNPDEKFGIDDCLTDSDVQATCDRFYASVYMLLDGFYPKSVVSVSNRDPSFITPQIKYMLRQKNQLMRKGKIEAANALAGRIKSKIVSSNSTNFRSINNVKDLWEKVRQ